MKEPNKDSKKRLESIAVESDLQRLQKSKAFKEAVLELNGNPSALMRDGIIGVQDLCYRFLIGDTEWMSHVIKYWDGKGLLPWTDNPEIYRSSFTRLKKGASFSPIRLGLWEGNFFATLKGFFGGTDNYFDGSPRLRRQSIYQRDESGERWMTLRVRLTEDLTEAQMHSWVQDEIFKAKNHKRPSNEALILDLLEQYPPNTKTIYGVTQYILKDLKPQLDHRGVSVKESQAKAIARKWVKEKKKT